MSNERWEELLYRELSEDRRHMTTMLWEIPTAIFLVNSFLLSMISITVLPFIVQKFVILFGLFFTIILTWSLFKVVKRAYLRAKELKKIEEKRKLPRYGMDEPRYLKAPLGYFMFALLILFIIFLIYLLASPQSLSPPVN